MKTSITKLINIFMLKYEINCILFASIIIIIVISNVGSFYYGNCVIWLLANIGLQVAALYLSINLIIKAATHIIKSKGIESGEKFGKPKVKINNNNRCDDEEE